MIRSVSGPLQNGAIPASSREQRAKLCVDVRRRIWKANGEFKVSKWSVACLCILFIFGFVSLDINR